MRGFAGHACVLTLLASIGCGGGQGGAGDDDGSDAGSGSGDAGVDAPEGDPKATPLYIGTLDDYPMALALTADGVVYLDEPIQAGGGARLKKIAFSGGERVVLAEVPLGYPNAVSIVGAGSHVAYGIENNRLTVVSTTGGGVDVVVPADNIAVGSAIGIRGDSIYFTSAGTIGAIPVADGAVTNVGSGIFGRVAISNQYAFWAGSDQIHAMPLGGGTANPIATEMRDLNALGADATDVYWLAHESGLSYSILTAAVGGSASRTVASGRISGVAAEGGQLYAVIDSKLVELDPATGAVKKELALPLAGSAVAALLVQPGIPYVAVMIDAFVEISPGMYSSRNIIYAFPR